MGFTLTSLGNEKKVSDVSIVNWSAILEFALINGWQPEGTDLPENNLYGEPYSDEDRDNWDGSYVGNHVGQIVRIDDSLALADALEVAITKDPVELMVKVDADPLPDENYPDFQTFYTDAGKQYIEDFIAFFRNGPFYII